MIAGLLRLNGVGQRTSRGCLANTPGPQTLAGGAHVFDHLGRGLVPRNIS